MREEIQKVRFYLFILMIMWTGLIVTLYAVQFRDANGSMIRIATMMANNTFEKDELYRLWNTMHGGVYVPADNNTQPNPYLSHVSERDVVTLSGRHLTLMNPAFMTRQVYELASSMNIVHTHLTSDVLINPVNKPDEWEKVALGELYGGVDEFASVSDIGGEPYLRFMRPFITVEGCLKCHAFQGYKVGDIRGGISVSIPLTRFLDIQRHTRITSLAVFVIIWVAGMLVLAAGFRMIIRMMLQLGTSRKHFRELYDQKAAILSSTGEAILGVDINGLITFVNPVVESMTGFNKSELLGKSHHEIVKHSYANEEPMDPDDCLVHKTLRDGCHRREEQLFHNKNGGPLHIEVLVSPVKKGADITGAVVSYYDISERIKSREYVKRSLEEKEVLLKEIHHRVKNNLQVISSFLSLQRDCYDSQEITEALKEAEGRVMAMALLHQSLYNSENLSEVKLDIYFNSLISNLVKNPVNAKPEVITDIDSESLSLDLIMSCGLILNELMTNSIKYAFNIDQVNPEIMLNIKKHGDEFIFTLRDNGKGFPENFDPESLDTLGLPIVINLVHQMGGVYKLENRGGAYFEMRFNYDNNPHKEG
jgi:PAS domain S-box-containing protein